MDRPAWCHVSGLVTAQWDRLLDSRAILALLHTDSAQDLQMRLRSSLLFGDEPPGDRPADEVEARFESAVRRVAAVSPDPAIADLFVLEREWREFRGFAREAVQPRSAAEGRRPEPDRAAGDATAAARRERFEAWWRGDAGDDPHGAAFVEAARRIQDGLPADGDRPGWVDRVADAAEAASLRAAADRLGSEELSAWVRAWLGLRAGLSLLRARLGGWPASAFLADWQRFGFDDPALATLAEGERPEWPGALDRLGLPAAEDLLAEAEPAVRLARRIDARLGELASAAGGIPFGPERVFAFLWALRMEALHLRLVLTAAAFGIPEDRVVGEWRAAHG